MKLATFSVNGGASEIGAVVANDKIVSLSRRTPRLAIDMADLIARWDVIEGDVRKQSADTSADIFKLSDVALLAPVRPRKVMAIGLNYADHIAETKQATPEHQLWFSKAVTSVNAPYGDIQIPKGSQSVDYEAELVTVIGKGGRRIGHDAVRSSIFGFCVGNDVSERHWQRLTPQWVLGKSFDTHAPIGPWITTIDEASDPHGRAIRCLVNGEVRQSSNTQYLVFNAWVQVGYLSQVMTLEPGDLIFTGTPGGVGLAMRPPTFLKAGDVVRVEIEGLGAIENRCVNE